MPILRTIAISQRLWLILVIALITLSLLISLALWQIHSGLYSAKVHQVRTAVENTSGILARFHQLEATGVLSREDAQEEALSMIRGLRHNQNEYFFIQSLTQQMLLHPINPGLEGQDVSALMDANGVAINKKVLQIAKNSGQGMLQYSWPKPGQSTPADKLSYVAL